MFSIPDILPTLADDMRQWATNNGTGLAKTLLQAVFYVKLARVNLNSLPIQRWNLCGKVIQDS